MSRQQLQKDIAELTSPAEPTSSKLDFAGLRIDFSRIAVVLSLGAAAALCLYHPISVFGIPLLFTEAFLFVVYTKL